MSKAEQARVWLVIEEVDYVGSDPVGVFSTEEAASAWIERAGYHEGTYVVYSLEIDVVRPHWADD